MDPFNLHRFVIAQKLVYADVLRELRTGKKTTHWMWFVFPQLAGLGRSLTAQRYALSGVEEASAYLVHPLLSSRLQECARLVLTIKGRRIEEILESPNDRKFQSCMTLFGVVAPGNPLWREALNYYYAGERDARTLALLR